MYFIGIDSGSTNTKIVLYKDKLIDYLIIETTWNPKQSALDAIVNLKEKHKMSDGDYIITTTGYGREIIDFANFSLTEISMHALGGYHLNSEINGIIDIGGQDCKIIELNNGQVSNFLMNDKCAAGTGSFLSMTCKKLNIEINMIDDFITSDEYVDIVSMCAVFAESEIVGLLAKMEDRSKILLGVIVSISLRIKQMIAKVGFRDTDVLLITGGLAQSDIVCKTLENITGLKIVNNNYSTLAGALGAAVYSMNKSKGVC